MSVVPPARSSLLNPAPFALPESVAEVAARLRAWRPVVAHDDLAVAAVATLVRPGRPAPEVLFIKRAEFEGDRWSGHVAFPGGKREVGDASLLHTAIRETHEELGLVVDEASLVARLPDLHGNHSRIQIAHFVFALDAFDVPLVPNAEVADAIWVPLRTLVDEEFAGVRDTDPMGRPATLPTIRLGPYVLWGMTLRLARAFTDALLSGPT